MFAANTYPHALSGQLNALLELAVVANDEALKTSVEELNSHVLSFGERTQKVIDQQAAAVENPTNGQGNPFTRLVLEREGRRIVHAAELLSIDLRRKAKVIAGPSFPNDWVEKAERVFDAIGPLLKDPQTAFKIQQNPQAALELLQENPDLAQLAQDVMTSDLGTFIMGAVQEVMMSVALGGKSQKDAIAEALADKIVDNGLEWAFGMMDKATVKSQEKAEVTALLAFADAIEVNAKALPAFSKAAIAQGGSAIIEQYKKMVELALGDKAELKGKIADAVKQLIDATPLKDMLGGSAGAPDFGDGIPMETETPDFADEVAPEADVAPEAHGDKPAAPKADKHDDQPEV